MTFKLVTLALVITLLIPSAVKFSHLFSNHDHEVCKGEVQSHLHKLDLDCKFYQFKLSSPFTLIEIHHDHFEVTDNHFINKPTYSLLSEFQKLHFSLRGPPLKLS